MTAAAMTAISVSLYEAGCYPTVTPHTMCDVQNAIPSCIELLLLLGTSAAATAASPAYHTGCPSHLVRLLPGLQEMAVVLTTM